MMAHYVMRQNKSMQSNEYWLEEKNSETYIYNDCLPYEE